MSKLKSAKQAFRGGQIKIRSEGIVMWIKASDNSTEAFFHNTAPKLRIVNQTIEENRPLSEVTFSYSIVKDKI